MRAWRLAWATATILLLAGCIAPDTDDRRGDDGRTETQGPLPDVGDVGCPGHRATPTASAGGQGGVSNNPGAFSYSGQAAAKVGKEVYLWQNPSSGAYVQWGGQTATGVLRITVQDTCGSVLYEKELSGMQQGGAQESSARGTPGEWAITLEFTAYTGQMGLSIVSG